MSVIDKDVDVAVRWSTAERVQALKRIVGKKSIEKVCWRSPERIARFAFGMAFDGEAVENLGRSRVEPGKLSSTWRFREWVCLRARGNA